MGPYRVPERIGTFTVRAQTGWGGTACTFIGSEPGPHGTERLKCLKVPSPLLLSELPAHEVRRIFQNEANVLRLLPPGSIAHLEDVADLGDEQGVMCLVFAYIDGMTLAQLIRKMRADGRLLAWDAVVGIARGIASALAEAHTDRRHEPTPYCHPPIVHRDVSPANVMLDVRGNAFLIDFGFARALEASQLYASRLHPGRVAYSAPEYLCDDDQGSYGPRLDLFSLGALLFEALTARQAFDGRSVERHIAQVRSKDRRRIEELRPEFYTPEGPDPDLSAFVHIVDCLLEPDPDDRFQSADALLSALSSLRVGVDQRPVGKLVRKYQSPLEQRVSSGRIDRSQVMSLVEARRAHVWVPPPARAAAPDEVLVDAAAAKELAQLAQRPTPEPLGDPIDFAATTPKAVAIPPTRDLGPSIGDDLADTNPLRPAISKSGVMAVVEREGPAGVALAPDAHEPEFPPAVFAPEPLSTPTIDKAAPVHIPPTRGAAPAPASATSSARGSFAASPQVGGMQAGPPSVPGQPPPVVRSSPVAGLAVLSAMLAGVTGAIVLLRDTVLVPLLSGNPQDIGEWVVLDHFWTPALNVTSGLCFAAALVVAFVAVAMHTKRQRSP